MTDQDKKQLLYQQMHYQNVSLNYLDMQLQQEQSNMQYLDQQIKVFLESVEKSLAKAGDTLK